MDIKGEIAMKFRIVKASSFTTEWSFAERFDEKNKPCKNAVLEVGESGDKNWIVELNTLDDLLALRSEINEELVVGFNNQITIYDDFIE